MTLQRNVLYAIYLLISICIPCLVLLIRVEFRTSKIKYKMKLFAKIVQGCGPSTIFVKNSISDVPLSLNTTLQIASHYYFSQKVKQLT